MTANTKKPPVILAIDTSCDETSVAVTKGQKILSNIIASQIELHKQYGGVFPTVAKQAHKDNIDATIKAAIQRSGITIKNIKAIAVTQGPGLAPALEIGIQKAIELGKKWSIPVIPVNHIEGHILSVLAQPNPRKKIFQTINPQLPALSVIVSGGHTEFILIEKIGHYKKLGATLDDAAGECLDKVGRLLGLGYPAGPVVEHLAKKGDPKSFPFPLPMTTHKTFDMSFSGLKTHSRKEITKLEEKKSLDAANTADFCASLQFGVFRHIIYKLEKLLVDTPVKELWLGGGVAANQTLRTNLRKTAKKNKVNCEAREGALGYNLLFRTPYSKKLCGDNAAMIGVTAGYKWKNNLNGTNSFDQSQQQETSQRIDRKPHWNIDSASI